MNKKNNQRLIQHKLLLQNPYAYMNEINYSQVDEETQKASMKQVKANRVMGNPYISMNNSFEDPSSKKNNNKYISPLNLKSSGNPYAILSIVTSKVNHMGNPYALINEKEPEQKKLQNKIKFNKPISDIEKSARELQSKIWKNRHSIWTKNIPLDPVEMLDPAVAFEVLGYDFDIYESLDDYEKDSDFKIAGLIDQARKKAYISNYYSPTQQRFTSAHELGHAILHPESNGMHRDRALDGGPIKSKRSKTEKEADEFAKFYTMPRVLIIRRFEEIFNTQNFLLDENTAFALDPSDKEKLLSQNISIRDISRLLAKTEYYNGRYITSLSKQFEVSIEAMAIRLEELELVS
jgi:Zn-dependent peptidase ImmA (M78 family)